jgi:protein arginine N-methyltransferase 5
METPYVVRSHAASQTHSEQECWTFTHPHSKIATKDMTTGTTDQNFSAEAARNVNNDRHAHLSFLHDPTHGAAMGCGYGPIDLEMQNVAAETLDDASSTPMNESTVLMIHGLLGTFHSVLYQSKDETKLSTISIAPHSFSVGMFSWFPLVSLYN